MPTRLLERIAAAEAASHARFGAEGETAWFGPLVTVASGQSTPIDTVWHDGSCAPTDSEWAEAEAFCERHGQSVTLHLLSHALPALLPTLTERGYCLEYGLHLLTHDLRPVAFTPAPLALREEADAERWARLAAAGFGPGTEAIMRQVSAAAGVRRFVASSNGEDVATAAFVLQGGIAAFHGASTLPEQRGQGAQKALLAYRLLEAKKAGAALASVFVTPNSLSEHNAERLGFRPAGMRLTFSRS